MNRKHKLIMSRTVFVLLSAVILLTTIGLVMLYSASMVRGNAQFDNSAHFITRQSLAAGTVCTRINLRWVRRMALPWLDYFVASVASVFKAVREEALQCARNGLPAEPDLLRKLDRRARWVFALFSRQDRITTPEVAGVLGLSDRMARNLVQGWVAEGWLVVAQASKRSRAYGLAESYRQFIGNLSAITPHKEREGN